jgi:hypothetical protein
MAQQVPFHITSGIPFAKTVEATLTDGRGWWTLESQFEVLCQIREAADVDSTLLLDLKQFLTITFVPGTDPDLVTIDLVMTGADTRLLTTSGFYDMVISDALSVDSRAISLIDGPVYRKTLVTSDIEEDVI